MINPLSATHMERKIINQQNVLKVVINDGVLIVNLLYMETKLAVKSKDKRNKINDFTAEHSFAFKIDDNNFQLPCEKTFLVDCGAGTQIVNNEENFIDFDERFDPT